MKITAETIKKVARLSRLKIEESDVASLEERLSSILTWVEQLEQVPTEKVEPMFSVHLDQMPVREDKVTDGDCHDAVLSNAPEEGLGMYSVPKVVE